MNTPTEELREAQVIYKKMVLAYRKNRTRFTLKVLFATLCKALIKFAVLLALMASLPWLMPRLLGYLQQYTGLTLPTSIEQKLNSLLQTSSDIIFSPEKFELTYLILAAVCTLLVFAGVSYRSAKKRVWNTQWSRHFHQFSQLRKALLQKLNTAFHTDWRVVFSNAATPYGKPLPVDVVPLSALKNLDGKHRALAKRYDTLTRYERPIAALEGVFLFSKQSELLLSFEEHCAVYGKLGDEPREIDLRVDPDA